MATAAAAARKPEVKEFNFTWVGQDKSGKTVRGEMRASGEAQVNSVLRRQGLKVVEVKKRKTGGGGSIRDPRRAGCPSPGCRCCRRRDSA